MQLHWNNNYKQESFKRIMLHMDIPSSRFKVHMYILLFANNVQNENKTILQY